jgi:hypothetical protein
MKSDITYYKQYIYARGSCHSECPYAIGYNGPGLFTHAALSFFARHAVRLSGNSEADQGCFTLIKSHGQYQICFLSIQISRSISNICLLIRGGARPGRGRPLDPRLIDPCQFRHVTFYSMACGPRWSSISNNFIVIHVIPLFNFFSFPVYRFSSQILHLFPSIFQYSRGIR